MTHPIIEGMTEAVTMAKLMRENDAAQARIAELEAESEALHRANIQLAKSCQKAHEALADSRDTAWNDAIEAAALAANSIVDGRIYFNQRARDDDKAFSEAILSLHR